MSTRPIKEYIVLTGRGDPRATRMSIWAPARAARWRSSTRRGRWRRCAGVTMSLPDDIKELAGPTLAHR